MSAPLRRHRPTLVPPIRSHRSHRNTPRNAEKKGNLLRTIRSIGTLAAVVIVPATTIADTIQVPGDFPLSVAIAVAADGDEIVISPDGSPYLVFPGIEITDKTLTIRGSTGDPTDVVIDGAGLDVTLTIIGPGSAGFVLQDLTITGGLADDLVNAPGGGMSVHNAGSMEIHNVVFEGNQMRSQGANGAGFFVADTDLLVVDTIVRNNTSTNPESDGIGAYIFDSNTTIIDSLFENNRAIDANGDPIPQTANGEGGGLTIFGESSAQITRCTFRGNMAGEGGAIWTGSGITINIDGCLFENNACDVVGGGVIIASSTLRATIRNSVFAGNTSPGVRGAALIADAPTVVTNCTFVDNSGAGDAINSSAGNTPNFIIDNSIVWANSTSDTIGSAGSALPIVRRSIVQGGFVASNGSGFNLDADPMFTDEASRDFSLSPGSPGIDSGDTNLYFGPAVDLGSNDRFTDDPNTSDTGFAIDGPVIDLGAFEFTVVSDNPSDTCPADIDGDDLIDLDDLLTVLGQFGDPCP